jgi:hypothetical protein
MTNPRLPLFEMLQPCVNYFFDPMQLGAPHFLSVIEPLVDSIESRVHVGPQIAETRIIDEDSHKYGDRWNADGKSDLNGLVSHRCLQHTSSGVNNSSTEPRPQGAIAC